MTAKSCQNVWTGRFLASVNPNNEQQKYSYQWGMYTFRQLPSQLHSHPLHVESLPSWTLNDEEHALPNWLFEACPCNYPSRCEWRPFWERQINSLARWIINIHIKNRHNHSTHRNLAHVAPIVSSSFMQNRRAKLSGELAKIGQAVQKRLADTTITQKAQQYRQVER